MTIPHLKAGEEPSPGMSCAVFRWVVSLCWHFYCPRITIWGLWDLHAACVLLLSNSESTDYQEIWRELYNTGGHLNHAYVNTLQLAITTWRAHELMT